MSGNNNASPPTYLSTSDGRWRIIHGGCTVTRDFDTQARAEEAASALRIKLPLPVWNGDVGAFTTVLLGGVR